MDKYQENVEKVTGPMTLHAEHGEIFLLRPGDVSYERIAVFSSNSLLFVGKEIRTFIHHKKDYYYAV